MQTSFSSVSLLFDEIDEIKCKRNHHKSLKVYISIAIVLVDVVDMVNINIYYQLADVAALAINMQFTRAIKFSMPI